MAVLKSLGAAATPFGGGQGQLPVSVNRRCNDTRDRRRRFRCDLRGEVRSGWRKRREAQHFSRGMASFLAWGSGRQYREPGSRLPAVRLKRSSPKPTAGRWVQALMPGKF